MSNSWVERNKRNSAIGQAGRVSERVLARQLGARPTAASGAKAHSKGDMRLKSPEHKFRIEAKSTKNATMALQQFWLQKIMGEAADAGEYPALTITFTDEGGKPEGHTWVAIPLYVFNELVSPE